MERYDFKRNLEHGTVHNWRFGYGTRNLEGDYYNGDQYIEPSKWTLEQLIDIGVVRGIDPELIMDEGF